MLAENGFDSGWSGSLNWLRRCPARIVDGHCVLDQNTNAYAILPASQWRG
jgi:hypothetical protein